MGNGGVVRALRGLQRTNGQSERQGLRPEGLVPHRDHHPGEGDGGDEEGDDVSVLSDFSQPSSFIDPISMQRRPEPKTFRGKGGVSKAGVHRGRKFAGKVDGSSGGVGGRGGNRQLGKRRESSFYMFALPLFHAGL